MGRPPWRRDTYLREDLVIAFVYLVGAAIVVLALRACIDLVRAAVGWWKALGKPEQPAKPAACQCAMCVAERSGMTDKLPADFVTRLSAGVAIVGAGAAPAVVLPVNITTPQGVGLVQVIAIDGALWDRVGRPAVEKHLQERAGGKAS